MKVYLLITYEDKPESLVNNENWSEIKVFTSAKQRDNAYYAVKHGIVERQDIVVDKRSYRKSTDPETPYIGGS